MKRNEKKLVISQRVVRNLDAVKGGQWLPFPAPGFPDIGDWRTIFARPDPPYSQMDTECGPGCPDVGSLVQTYCATPSDCQTCPTEDRNGTRDCCIVFPRVRIRSR
jgi:hypothetical protein